MKFGQWQISVSKSKSSDETLKSESFLEKYLSYEEGMLVDKGDNAYSYGRTGRPVAEEATMSDKTGYGGRIPIYPMHLWSCYAIANDVDAVRLPIDVLVREIFRNGFEIVAAYQYRCLYCGTEYRDKPEVPSVTDDAKMKCDVCGKTKMAKPNPKSRKKLMDLLDNYVNNNKQLMQAVLEQIEHDMEVADMGYMVLIKDYERTSNGGIGESKLKEIMRLSPVQTLIVADAEARYGFNDDGEELFFCPQHRNELIAWHEGGTASCRTCGMQGLRAYLEVRPYRGSAVSGSVRRTYYGLNEAIVKHGKYRPSLMYGYPLPMTFWNKAVALRYQDEYVKKYFDKMRPPRAMLVVGSRNQVSLQKAFDTMKEQQRKDPYTIHPLMVETERGGRQMVQYINLTDSLEDLQFIQVRDEYRRTIGAMYGVTGIFEGDVPSGWNNEGSEVMVTNRAVERGQKVINEDFLKPLCRQMGVTDWVIRLRRGEAVDELRDEQLENQRIMNAQAMQQLGFSVERNADGRFTFSQKPVVDPHTDEQSQQSKQPNKDEVSTSFSGESNPKRPSDAGGVGQGFPASGEKTSLSKR